MQQESSNAKQLIVERIKQSTNILVTVSANPSVDALSAALSLTLMVNKLDKHGAAVFSGVIPPAINFLSPGKTFEHNVDSLRDFIIALDKEKADRLRYKVEDDVVKIFITPYRTTITEKDLQFSQGDFNVDLIVALGVERREDLDSAIVAHGRILHDATVVTINAANQKSSLGSTDWHDPSSSSLCEMLAGLAGDLKGDALDQQISTALLTGIVAATDRFSNRRTTPQVMTIAAQLMAAGANQQLIASNLEGVKPIPSAQSTKITKAEIAPAAPEAQSKKADGEMQIQHEKPAFKPPAAPAPAPAPVPKPQPPKVEEELQLPIAPPAAAQFDNLKEAIKEETAKEPEVVQRLLPTEPPAPGSKAVNAASEEQEDRSEPEPQYLTDRPSWKGRTIQPPDHPMLGGTLNATAEQALQDERQREQNDQNKTLLTHDESNNQLAAAPLARPASKQRPRPKARPKLEPVPAPAPAPPPPLPELVAPPVPVAEETPPEPQPPLPPAPIAPAAPQAPPTIEQIEQKVADFTKPEETPEADLQAARAAVNEALESMPSPYEAEADMGAQPLPALTQQPEGSPQPAGLSLSPAPTPPPLPAASPNPPLPPMPDFSQLPSLPPVAPGEPSAVDSPAPLSLQPQTPQEPTPPAIVAQPKPQDPGQFHIPGQ